MLTALLLVPAALVYAGWRHGRPTRTLALVSVGLLGIWGLSALAVETDYRDADGFVDCWPGCTVFQDAVRLGFLGVLPVLVALAILTALLVLVSARRERAARLRE